MAIMHDCMFLKINTSSPGRVKRVSHGSSSRSPCVTGFMLVTVPNCVNCATRSWETAIAAVRPPAPWGEDFTLSAGEDECARACDSPEMITRWLRRSGGRHAEPRAAQGASRW
eukprot:1199234-Pleurochrysis_carterae.AAC.3